MALDAPNVRRGVVGRDAVHTLAYRFFILGAGLATNIIVARTIGPAGKGTISFLQYTLFIVMSLGSLGLQTAAIQQLGKGQFGARTVSATQIALSAILGLLGAVAVAVLLPVVRGKIEIGATTLLAFLPVIVLAIINLNLAGMMIGMGRIGALNRVQALGPALWVAVSFILLVLLHGGIGAGVHGWILIQWIPPIVMLVWVLRAAPPLRAEMRSCAKETLRFGFVAYLANLLWALMLRIDGFLLGNIWGAERVGTYSVAVLLAEMLWYLPSSLTLAMSQRMSSDTHGGAIDLTHRAARIGLWYVGAGAIGLSLLAPWLIRVVYGTAFLPALRPLWILLPGVIAIAVAKPLSLYYTQQKGSPRTNAWISGIAVTLNIGLNLLWIPRHGAIGAAAASSISYALVALFLVIVMRREPGFSLRAALIIRKEDIEMTVRTLRRLFAPLAGLLLIGVIGCAENPVHLSASESPVPFTPTVVSVDAGSFVGVEETIPAWISLAEPKIGPESAGLW